MRTFALFLLLAVNSLSAVSIWKKETGNCEWIKDYIVQVPDFPKAGITFITFAPLLENSDAFIRSIQAFADRYKDKDIGAIAGIDSRGFIFGSALAYELKKPFIMIRKAGKLPRPVARLPYELEYGTGALEVEVESLKAGMRVLIIDDILATGGTVKAASELIEKLGGQVAEVACLIELSFLKGREKVGRPVYSLIALD